MLIDSASLWYRAYYGMPDTLLSPDGVSVNAVRGYLDMTSRLIQAYKPDRLVACLDGDWRPSWRVDIFPDYKANRVEDDGESEEEPEDEEGDDEENPFAKASMREYVEKVAPAKMGDNGVSNKSTVAGKNPLGNTGTTANIAKGGESNKGGTQGGLANPSTKDLNTGNVNVPGSKTATKMHPTKGHGAEKKGSGDNGVNTRSIVGK